MKWTFAMFLASSNYTLVFTLSQGICSSYGPLSNEKHCPNAFSYISIFGIGQTLLNWTVGYSLIEIDKNISKVSESTEFLSQQDSINRPSIWRNTLNTLKMPNPISCLIGIVLAMIPGFKELLFSSEGIFLPLGSALKNIGLIGIVWGQVLMGSNIYMMIGKESRLRKKQIAYITFAKVLIFPAVSLSIIYITWNLGVFGDDRLQAYILYMCVSCPTSIIIVLISNVFNINTDEISQCIFTVYLFSIFAMVLWTFLFFLLIT